MDQIKLERVQRMMIKLFEFGEEYLFTPILVRRVKGKLFKKYYCICYNDGKQSGKRGINHLIRCFSEPFSHNSILNHCPPEPSDCRFGEHLFASSMDLVDHYLKYHRPSLGDFLEYVLINCKTDTLKCLASNVLINWTLEVEDLLEDLTLCESVDVISIQEPCCFRLR
ncbi:uncharacterized protein LOC141849485 [Brevipalpus obovatus]|uniref:uncharacterized protein LOC141849485 n=1 Tax=Brevipalpus obovatus TaxID=246614 RepID=UPI003D9E5D12